MFPVRTLRASISKRLPNVTASQNISQPSTMRTSFGKFGTCDACWRDVSPTVHTVRHDEGVDPHRFGRGHVVFFSTSSARTGKVRMDNRCKGHASYHQPRELVARHPSRIIGERHRREPFVFIEDAGFNYKYFNRRFAMKKETWFADRPPEVIEGHEIRNMVTERMAFVGSRSEALIQAVDVLTSYSFSESVSAIFRAPARHRHRLFHLPRGGAHNRSEY
jgi:hypothetical protein